MKIYIENISASSIVYMRRIGAYGQDNFKLMHSMKEWLKLKNLWNDDGIIYAIAQDDPNTTPSEKCRYDVCFVIEESFNEDSIFHGHLSSGMYLICQIPHTSDSVQSLWTSLEDMLSENERQFDESRVVLERYPISLVESGYCEFCIPIIN